MWPEVLQLEWLQQRSPPWAPGVNGEWRSGDGRRRKRMKIAGWREPALVWGKTGGHLTGKLLPAQCEDLTWVKHRKE